MQDQYTGLPGTFIVDPEAGIRVPAEDFEIYMANKSAYLADPDKARESFKAAGAKPSKPKTDPEV